MQSKIASPGTHDTSEEYELRLALRQYAAALGAASIDGFEELRADQWTASAPPSPGGHGTEPINEPNPRRRGSDTARCNADDSGPSLPCASTRRHRAPRQLGSARPAVASINTFYLPPLLTESELEGVVSIRSPKPRSLKSKSSAVGLESGSGAGTSGVAGTGAAYPPSREATLKRKVRTQTTTLRKVSSFFACCPASSLEERPGAGEKVTESPSSPADQEPHWITAFKQSQARQRKTLRKRPSAAQPTFPQGGRNHKGATIASKVTPRDMVRDDVFGQAVAHSLGLFPVDLGPECETSSQRPPAPPPKGSSLSAHREESSTTSQLSGSPKVPFPLQWFTPSYRSESSEEFPIGRESLDPPRVRPKNIGGGDQFHPLNQNNIIRKADTDDEHDVEDHLEPTFKYNYNDTDADQTTTNWLKFVDADHLSEITDALDVEFGPVNFNAHLPEHAEPTIQRVIEWRAHVSPVHGPLENE